MSDNIINTLGLKLKKELKNPTQIGKKIFENSINNVPTIDKFQRAQEEVKTYAQELEWAINEGCSKSKHDFYVEMMYKRDPVHHQINRITAAVRTTCPYPIYNRAAYKVNRKTGEYVLLWHIPQKAYVRNPHLISLVHPGREELLQSIRNFKDGKYKMLFDKLIEEERKYE